MAGCINVWPGDSSSLGSEQAGIGFMSHLSILPTVFTRLDLLERALHDEGFMVLQQADLDQFGTTPVRVDLLASLDGCCPLGWSIQSDGTIDLHGDLQRISSQIGLAERLQRVTRRYALLDAFAKVSAPSMPPMQVSFNALPRV